MSSRRRYRVVARPRERARRARTAAAVFAVAALGGVAAVAARHAAGALGRFTTASSLRGLAGGGPVAVEGAPEPLRTLAQAAADAASGSARDKAAAVEARFPCVKRASLRRVWGERRWTLTLELRRAVAPAAARGRPAGYLGDDGAVFAAPEGLYALSGPVADVGSAGERERRALAQAWPALTAPGGFPSPLAEMSYVSADDGWRARLEDGTLVEWGGLRWTEEKFARLGEALGDARLRGTPGALAADLRWFEDGKVLLRPATPAARGGLK